MPEKDGSRSPRRLRARKGNGPAEPIPEVDESVRREARTVGLVAVLFAAGISAQALYSLGLLIGISPWIAWMLPGAMDLYAFESTRVASRVPARHPSRGWAVWNARLALSFTVAGNALFHALHLASGHHGWTNTDVALTAVSAVPPVIVERFLHLQTKINAPVGSPAPAAETGTGAPAKDGGKKAERHSKVALEPGNENPGTPQLPAPSPAPPALNPAAEAALTPPGPGSETPELPAVAGEAKGGTVTQIDGNGRRSPKNWAKLGMPYYRRFTDENGQGPTASTFVQHLRDTYPHLPVPRSERAERNIRAAAEELLKAGDVEPDRELEVA